MERQGLLWRPAEIVDCLPGGESQEGMQKAWEWEWKKRVKT
ncbi:hypothetical protein [Okibacterium endophyticum]